MSKLAQFILAAFAILMLAIILAGAYFLVQSDISALVGLPMLSIAAVVLLLLVLSAMAVIYVSYNIHDSSQALALPEGSIRAVIALMLIVLFAILAIYLFGKMTEGGTTKLGVMDQPQIAEVRAIYPNAVVAVPRADGKGYNVWLKDEPNRDSVDFAKQLLVLVGTLVTSIASFYFGSRAVESEKARVEAAQPPVVTGLDPPTYIRGSGKKPFKLTGQGLTGIGAVSLANGDKRITVDKPVIKNDQIAFEVDLPLTEQPGVWAVRLADAKGADLPTAAVGLMVN